MQIKKAQYLLTAVKASQYPEAALPAVTFCGRSNVGKSSLINCLLNRRNLARTSSQPGKTRTINFYAVDDRWYLVDLPGYGFAKVSKSERDNWRFMIDEYMRRYNGPNLFLQLVDIRHEPSALDKQMWAWLQSAGVECRLIATKADKISRGARDRQLALISKTLQTPKKDIIAFSSVNRDGRDELLRLIGDYLAESESAGEGAADEMIAEEAAAEDVAEGIAEGAEV